MKRWIVLMCFAAACQLDTPPPTTGTTTDTSAAALTCKLPPATCGVAMPPLGAWNGQFPQAGATQMFVMFPNWEAPGDYVLTLVDYASYTIPWGVKIKAADVPDATKLLHTQELVLGGPRPPLPPPGPIGGTLTAAFVMNLSFAYALPAH